MKVQKVRSRNGRNEGGNVKPARKDIILWGRFWERVKPKVASHTSDEVPQVETFVPFHALVGNLACVVNAERQTDQREAHSHQQEQDHHHVEAAVQRPHKLWENWTDKKHRLKTHIISRLSWFVCVCQDEREWQCVDAVFVFFWLLHRYWTRRMESYTTWTTLVLV